MALRERRFKYQDKLKDAVAKKLRLTTSGSLAMGNNDLTTQWNVVIEQRWTLKDF